MVAFEPGNGLFLQRMIDLLQKRTLSTSAYSRYDKSVGGQLVIAGDQPGQTGIHF